MNPFPYAMFIFVKLQNCVKRQTDTCFPVQNTQEFGHFSGRVYKNRKCTMQNTERHKETPLGNPAANKLNNVLFFDIFHDVSNLALKNFTERFERVSADTFVAFQPCNLSRTDAIFLYKSVLRNAFLFQNAPQTSVRNHNIQAFYLLAY